MYLEISCWKICESNLSLKECTSGSFETQTFQDVP